MSSAVPVAGFQIRSAEPAATAYAAAVTLTAPSRWPDVSLPSQISMNRSPPARSRLGVSGFWLPSTTERMPFTTLTSVRVSLQAGVPTPTPLSSTKRKCSVSVFVMGCPPGSVIRACSVISSELGAPRAVPIQPTAAVASSAPATAAQRLRSSFSMLLPRVLREETNRPVDLRYPSGNRRARALTC